MTLRLQPPIFSSRLRVSVWSWYASTSLDGMFCARIYLFPAATMVYPTFSHGVCSNRLALPLCLGV